MAGKKGRTKTTAATVPVPQTRAEAEAAIAEIGDRQRIMQRIGADMNDRLAAIKEGFEQQAAPHKARIDALTEGVEVWAAANRVELTKGGKTKTAALATGEIRWRITPPSVVVRGAEAVMDALRRAGLTRFIRTKDSIDKDAILAEPESVAGIRGVRIEQREELVIVPFEAELEAAQ